MRINRKVIDLGCENASKIFGEKINVRAVFKTEVKGISQKLPSRLPFGFTELSQKFGRYKLDSRNYLIDELAKVTDKSGNPRFKHSQIKRAVQKYTTFGRKPLFNDEREYQRLYGEAVRFAQEEPNATLEDIARFANLGENTWAAYLNLPEARKPVFRQMLKYIQPQWSGLILSDMQRIGIHQTLSSDGLNFLPGIFGLLSKGSDEMINIYQQLLKLKAPKGPFPNIKGFDHLFNHEEIWTIANIKGLDIKEFIKLSKTSGLPGFSLTEIAQVEGINLKKLAKEIKRIKKLYNGNVIINIEREPYEKNKFLMEEWGNPVDKAKAVANENKFVLLKAYDNEANLLSTTRAMPVKGQGERQVRLIGKDFETVQEARNYQTEKVDGPIKNHKEIYTVSETRQIKDKDGKLIRTEYMTPSVIDGIHNWKAVYPDGTVKPIINVQKRNGALIVTKDMESLDGVTTKSKFKQLKNGSYAMKLAITDGEETLAKRFVSHRIISPNRAISTVNGEKFNVIYSPNEIRVQSLNGKKSFSIDLEQLIDQNATPQEAEKLKNLLKQLSADELEIVHKKVKKLSFYREGNNGFATPSTGGISTNDDIFTFKHELGHIEDLTGTNMAGTENLRKIANAEGKISGKKDFIETHDKERKSFMDNFFTIQRKYIDYFIDQLRRANSQEETAAEHFASKGATNTNPMIGTRTEYIERFMPRTRSIVVNG